MKLEPLTLDLSDWILRVPSKIFIDILSNQI